MKLNSKYIKGKSLFLALLGVFTLIYVALASTNFYYLLPTASHDDELQLRLAQSLAAGEWLGEYDSLTLAKGITYPIWQAVLHLLSIPLWLGNAVLYASACLCLIFALRYIVTNKWLLLTVYLFLLFNPMLPLRSYRDIIAPALAVLIITWVIGLFLAVTEYRKKIIPDRSRFYRDSLIFTGIGTLALPAWWYLREDAFYILPLIVGAFAVALGILIFQVIQRKVSYKRIASVGTLMLAPFIVVVLIGTLIASMNQINYGRNVVNDYTSKEFKSAYGALMRVRSSTEKPRTVHVSEEMRLKIYRISPTFNQLEPCLDENAHKGSCEYFKFFGVSGVHDYEGGWLAWAIRLAADHEGYYDNPLKAERFYNKLAKEVNDACDRQLLGCTSGERASLAPPFESADLGPTAINALVATKYFYELRIPPVREGPIGADSFSLQKEAMANFLSVKYSADQANNPTSQLGIKIRKGITLIYSSINPILMGLATFILLVGTAGIKKFSSYWRELLIGWALLLLLVLRIAMLAYVHTTSFPAINTAYLASIYPVMFLFEALMGTLAVNYITKKRKKTY